MQQDPAQRLPSVCMFCKMQLKSELAPNVSKHILRHAGWRSMSPCASRNRGANHNANTALLDRSIALLRVHLPCHHVLPILVLGSGSRSRSHLDCCCSRPSALYFTGCLVRLPKFSMGHFNLINGEQGSFASGTQKSEMSVTLVRCCSGVRNGPGGLLASCSS
jgi:hypothetical protein